MFVKPNPDKKVGDEPLKVFDPVHKDFLPEIGRKVADNAYWMRRLITKDVVEVKAIETPEKKVDGKTNNSATNAKSQAKTKSTGKKAAGKTANSKDKGE